MKELFWIVINSLVNWLGCLKTCFHQKARFFYGISHIINSYNVYIILLLIKQ